MTICREIGNKEGEGTTLNNLGQIYKALGDYATAQGYLEQSLIIRREIGDKAGKEGTTLNNLSPIYDARGDYATAQGYLEQSLSIRCEIGDKAGEGTTLNNLRIKSIKRAGTTTPPGAISEQSLIIQREIGDKAGMIATLHNMAHIALQANKGEQALTLWSEALQLAVETQNAQGIFEVAGTLGTLFARAGNKEQAEQLLRLAIKAGRQAGFPEVKNWKRRCGG